MENVRHVFGNIATSPRSYVSANIITKILTQALYSSSSRRLRYSQSVPMKIQRVIQASHSKSKASGGDSVGNDEISKAIRTGGSKTHVLAKSNQDETTKMLARLSRTNSLRKIVPSNSGRSTDLFFPLSLQCSWKINMLVPESWRSDTLAGTDLWAR
jgi:hypothetical protein